MQRRRALLAALGLAALSGCGFELRRAPELRFRSIALTGFGPKSALADELRRQIGASPGTRMMSRTSITSTSGVMLISERMESSSWVSPPVDPRKAIR